MTTTRVHAPSTHKVRRRALGGKPARGHERQRTGRPVRRGNPQTIVAGKDDPTLTSVGGLGAFGVFLQRIGFVPQLHTHFARLKSHKNVVYGMPNQIRMLIDAELSGCHRVFGLEALAGDALFTYLAGGELPCLDTVYRDLERFDADALVALERLMFERGLADVTVGMFKRVHLDIDTTVLPLFGEQEGARKGHNSRYHGRPSYHPIVARLAESSTVVGAKLRYGDTGFGAEQAADVIEYVSRVRRAVGKKCQVYVRIDGAADCVDIMSAIDDGGDYFVTKADMTKDLIGAIAAQNRWTTIDADAYGKPTLQVAEIDFCRDVWRKAKTKYRVVAVRSTERLNGKQIALWDNDFTVQAFITNDRRSSGIEVAETYDGRAGIESQIADWKGAWNIGKVPSKVFDANHAAFLLKLLSFNLMRSWLRADYTHMLCWRTAWVRRALILRPGRLLRSGRSHRLRLAPRPTFEAMLN